MDYHWRGNVRQLENVVHAAWICTRGGPVTARLATDLMREQPGLATTAMKSESRFRGGIFSVQVPAE